VSATRKAVQVLIRGRVQGVGYHAWTAAEAEARGLDGWVRNRRDGAVEAVFAGPAVAVDGMLAAAKAGPRDARVTAVEIVGEGGYAGQGFEVRATV